MSNNNIHTDPSKRHDFVLLFEVERGNPNGDPDAGNLPRVDPETGHGIVTDVCLKRKVRDYLQLTKGLDIFIQSETALNRLISNAAKDVGVEQPQYELNEDHLIELFRNEALGNSFDVDGNLLTYTGESRKEKDIKAALKPIEGEFKKKLDEIVEKLLKDRQCELEDEYVLEIFKSEPSQNFELDGSLLKCTEESKEDKDVKAAIKTIEDKMKKKLNEIAKSLKDSVKNEKLTDADRTKTQKRMIEKYYDIKMFGAVLSTGLNAGQVRGPAQLTFAKSVDPIFRLDNAITRKAVTKEEDKKRKETEMARKPIVPYALYVAHGFYNPYFALKPKTKKDAPDEYMVEKTDLENLWEALEWMFNNDTAAARGRMATRGLYVFTHDNKRGNAPSHKLFDRIKIRLKDEKIKKDEPAEQFCDYQLKIDDTGLKDLKINLEKIVHDEKMDNCNKQKGDNTK